MYLILSKGIKWGHSDIESKSILVQFWTFRQIHFTNNQLATTMSERFSVEWNDYQQIWRRSLSELRKETDFSDVTLVTDDKVKFSAHRILLSSCSNTLKFILKDNMHSNPLLYLSGINSVNLGFILDYMYCGEVKLYQEQLDGFRVLAVRSLLIK